MERVLLQSGGIRRPAVPIRERPLHEIWGQLVSGRSQLQEKRRVLLGARSEINPSVQDILRQGQERGCEALRRIEFELRSPTESKLDGQHDRVLELAKLHRESAGEFRKNHDHFVH